MPDQAALKDDIHRLGLEVAGLKPLVREVHGYMPRITDALEVLARITEKLESNAEDHKRLHYRITGVENDVKSVEEDFKELATATANNQGRLEERFNKLHDEHLECMTAKRVEKTERRKGFWVKVQSKIEERAVDIIVWILISFTVWMALEHIKMYSTSEIVKLLKK